MILLKVCARISAHIKGYFFYLRDFINYYLNGSKRFPLKFRNLYPCLSDRTTTTDFDRHYVYHTAWAARKVLEIKPIKHIDVSSSLFFCSSISATIPTEFYDYRPAPLKLSGLTTHFSDLCNLPFSDESIQSLSCMHVVEHVGLGRYGDKVDPDGDLQAFKELKRVVAKNGNLLLVLPIGRARVQFNAHRIYSSQEVKDLFAGWELKEFYLIPDKKFSEDPIINPADDVCEKQEYGCGCFWLKKI